jgi:5-methylcytosine-specific restriction endonuclease McrA
MHHQALLLNHNYEVLCFVTERKAIRLLLKDKADPLHVWDDYFVYLKKKINYPSVLRLRYLVRKPPHKPLGFSRRAVLKRDEYLCQYCGCELYGENMTIDHIIPRSLGGPSSFMNCVASCSKCNRRKGSRTLEQTGMILRSQPFIPSLGTMQRIDNKIWHNDWRFYLG